MNAKYVHSVYVTLYRDIMLFKGEAPVMCTMVWLYSIFSVEFVRCTETCYNTGGVIACIIVIMHVYNCYVGCVVQGLGGGIGDGNGLVPPRGLCLG